MKTMPTTKKKKKSEEQVHRPEPKSVSRRSSGWLPSVAAWRSRNRRPTRDPFFLDVEWQKPDVKENMLRDSIIRSSKTRKTHLWHWEFWLQQLKAFHLSRLLSWRLFGARKSQVVPCADVYCNAVNILWQSFSSASHLDRTHGEGRREEKCFAQWSAEKKPAARSFLSTGLLHNGSSDAWMKSGWYSSIDYTKTWKSSWQERQPQVVHCTREKHEP